MASDSSSHPTSIYFGYGSNLWREQMHRRCPQSTFLGIGRLQGWRWIINERGYANVVQIERASCINNVVDNQVWGLIYRLTSTDEAALDVNEGVPYAYTKEVHKVDFWSMSQPDADSARFDPTNARPKVRDMLVYVDRRRVVADRPRGEYVYRMNRGIKDALACGIPHSYVEKVLRSFISESAHSPDADSVRLKAEEQARGFKDESGVIPDQ